MIHWGWGEGTIKEHEKSFTVEVEAGSWDGPNDRFNCLQFNYEVICLDVATIWEPQKATESAEVFTLKKFSGIEMQHGGLGKELS